MQGKELKNKVRERSTISNHSVWCRGASGIKFSLRETKRSNSGTLPNHGKVSDTLPIFPLKSRNFWFFPFGMHHEVSQILLLCINYFFLVISEAKQRAVPNHNQAT